MEIGDKYVNVYGDIFKVIYVDEIWTVMLNMTEDEKETTSNKRMKELLKNGYYGKVANDYMQEVKVGDLVHSPDKDKIFQVEEFDGSLVYDIEYGYYYKVGDKLFDALYKYRDGHYYCIWKKEW